MITLDTILLTTEMTSFGVTRNEADFMQEQLTYLHCYQICDPRFIIEKSNFSKRTRVKTFKTLSRYLHNLEKNNFIELHKTNDNFEVNIMPFLLRLQELQDHRDERLKDEKDPFYD